MARIIKVVEAVLVSVLFFGSSYMVGWALGVLFPSLIILDPWSIMEALVALIGFGGFTIGIVLHVNKKSTMRLHFLQTTASRHWLVSVLFIILAGIAILGILVAGSGSGAADSMLRYTYWGSWVLCLVIAVIGAIYTVYLYIKK